MSTYIYICPVLDCHVRMDRDKMAEPATIEDVEEHFYDIVIDLHNLAESDVNVVVRDMAV
jgi:hypothetical protein